MNTNSQEANSKKHKIYRVFAESLSIQFWTIWRHLRHTSIFTAVTLQNFAYLEAEMETDVFSPWPLVQAYDWKWKLQESQDCNLIQTALFKLVLSHTIWCVPVNAM